MADNCQIGVRYCGGCNPRYDRTGALAELKAALPGVRFVPAAPGQAADALLARPADSIAQIAAGCGFDNPSNFSQQFRRFYGCSPRAYRTRKRG